MLGQVIALDPTASQEQAFRRAAGAARQAYNWGLGEWQLQYKQGGKPSANKLARQYTELKKTIFSWAYESPQSATGVGFLDLKNAYQNFFKSLKGERKGKKSKYPRFKKKGRRDGFALDARLVHFSADGKHVDLPVIGSVRTHHPRRFVGKIGNVRVKLRAGRWFISFHTEGDFQRPSTPKREVVGVDLGVKTALVCSDGTSFDAPNPLKKDLQKLARANRRLHKRKKGSKNRKKAQHKVSKIHNRISNIRKDFVHKVTTKLCRENQTIVLEDLNVAGMLRNHKLARAIADVGFGEVRRQLEYKSKIFGNTLIAANRWFPSSKRCSCCGEKKEHLSLSEREYHCRYCGLIIDRDLNAARNLEVYGTAELAGTLDSFWKVKYNVHEDRTSTPRAKGREASPFAEMETSL